MEFVDERTQLLARFWKLVKHECLLDPDKLKKAVQKMSELESKIQKHKRRFDDFKNLITFILETKQKLKAMTKELHKTQIGKEIDEILMAVISSRFGMAQRNYSTKIEFWKFWIKTNMDAFWYDHVSTVYKKYSNSLGQTDPSLWIEGAFFPLRRNASKGIDEARGIMQQCLRRHSDTPEVYTEWCRLELIYIAILRAEKSKKKVSDADLSDFEPLNLVYNEIKETEMGGNSSWYIELYKLAKSFTFAEDFGNQVLNDLKINCAECPETHAFLAKIALFANRDFPSEKSVAACLREIENGCRLIPTKEMYTLYLNIIKEIEQELRSFGGQEVEGLQQTMIVILWDVYERVYAEDFLSRDDYVIWIKIAQSKESPIPEVDLTLVSLTLSEQQKAEEEEEEQEDVIKPKKKKIGQSLESIKKSTAEIVDLALEKYPGDWEFIDEKIKWIIINPKLFHLWYGKKRVDEILKLLNQISYSEESTVPAAFNVWQRSFNYTLMMKDCNDQVEKIIELAPNTPSQDGFKTSLLINYIQFLCAKNQERKAKKYIRKLKLNSSLLQTCMKVLKNSSN